MFPTFDLPQAQTVGEHRRKRSQEKNVRRASTSASSQSTRSTKSDPAAVQHLSFPGQLTEKKPEKSSSGFGGFLKSREKRSSSSKSSRASDNEPKQQQPEARPEFRPTSRAEQEALRQSLDTLRLESISSSEDEREVYAINRTQRLPAQQRPPSSKRPPPIPNIAPKGHSQQRHTHLPGRGPSTRSGTSEATTKSGASVFSAPIVFDANYSEDSESNSPVTTSFDSRNRHRKQDVPSPNDSTPKLPVSGERPRAPSRATKSSLGMRPKIHEEELESSFSRTLSRMETAGLKIIATRLSEEWEFDKDDEEYHEIEFEKKLWSLTAYSWLTQGKQIQSPTNELLLDSSRSQGKKVLHVNGDLATGWVLAAKYPTCTVYTLSSTNSTQPPTTHSPPPNHHSLYIPSSAADFPFPDCYFDSVVSRAMLTATTSENLPRRLRDCLRVLKPGSHLEILSIEANLMRGGPFTSVWTDDHITTPLLENGYSTEPTETLRHALTLGGFNAPRQVRIALPVALPKTPSGPAQPPARLMTVLGRHLYLTAFGRLAEDSGVQSWFWTRADIRSECERLGTKIAVSITVAEKPS